MIDKKTTARISPVDESKAHIKHKYLFPNSMAKIMGKLTTQVQMEASMTSLVFILVGMMIMAVYMMFFTEVSLFVKIMTGLNMIAGFIFLSSFLTTSFQQYVSYMMAQEIQKDFFGGKENEWNEWNY